MKKGAAVGKNVADGANESDAATAVDAASESVFPNDYEAKRVIVYLIRHGEREDEVERSFRRDRTLKERVDPALTEEGYRQAAAAFHSLLSRQSSEMNETRRAALFASPLRRTVGTAMMVASAAAGHFRFQLPLDANNNAEAAEFPADSGYILHNIVVLNGLCDCAAAIGRLRGTAQAVSDGFIDCASVSYNYLRPKSTAIPNGNTIVPCIQNLKQTSSAAVAATKQTADGTQHTTRPTTNVRFWGELRQSTQQNTDNISFQPMTPPFDPTNTHDIQSHGETTPSRLATVGKAVGNAVGKCTSTTANALSVPFGGNTQAQNNSHVPQDTFLAAANRAVLHCIRSGIDTCVIVTHREGIRDLAQDICRYYPNSTTPSRRKSRLSTPYCCIGSFVATVYTPRQQDATTLSFIPQSERDKRIKWTFLDVSPYETFAPAYSSTDQIPSPLPPATGESTVQGIWGSENKSMRLFATLSLARECDQGNSPTERFDTLILSSFAREEEGAYREAEWSRLLKFHIWDGRKKFVEILREMEMRGKTLYGTLQPSGEAVMMRVSDQDELPPCPLEHIYVRVRNYL